MHVENNEVKLAVRVPGYAASPPPPHTHTFLLVYSYT